MVITAETSRTDTLNRTTSLVRFYVLVVLATVVALAVLSATHADQATSEAWGHAIVVGVFAVLLPLRLRAARHGSAGAIRAVAVISGVLAAVNLVEAALPHFVPTWMRIEMVGIAVLMLAVLASVLPSVVRGRR